MAQRRADSGQQLVHAEGLGHVVVGALVEGRDLGHLIAAAPSTKGTAFATGGTDDRIVRAWEPGAFNSWRSYAKARSGIGLVANADRFVPAHTSFKEVRLVSKNGRREARNDVYGLVRILDEVTGIELAVIDASDHPSYSIEFAKNDEELREHAVRYPTVFRSQDRCAFGQALINEICAENMSGAIPILTEADLQTAPVIRGSPGDNVCVPPSLLDQLRTSIRFLLGN